MTNSTDLPSTPATLPSTPASHLPPTQKRKRPAPLNLDTLLPHSKRPSTSPPHKVSQQNTQHYRLPPSSPTKADSTPTLPASRRLRRLPSCSITETFHSVHSPNIQSPALPPDSAPVIRMRTSFTYSQLEILEDTFSKQNQISHLHSCQIAGEFELPVECITSWFSNRRHLQRKREQRRLNFLNLRAKQKSTKQKSTF